MAIKITVLKNGPLMLEGDLAELQVADAKGEALDLGDRPKAWLCRCGASANKPFCDGQHAKIGFDAA
jgi:CDGSH-type Zn-finger protein